MSAPKSRRTIPHSFCKHNPGGEGEHIGVKFWEFLKSRLVGVGRWSKVHLRNKRYLAFLLNLSGFLPAAGDFFRVYEVGNT